MNPYVTQAVAAEHVRDLHVAAERHRRAVLARGGRPSWRTAATARVAASLHSLREVIRREQLGPMAGACTTC
jgi:hypothetical protein